MNFKTLPLRRIAFVVAMLPASVTLAGDSSAARAARMLGHSEHGPEFDEGPREKPVKLEGIGSTHLPITTKVPEVQQWFDQGNTLLHSFWYYEAERSFRWCLKLDPECAMAWWGLARCSDRDDNGKRLRKCLYEAVRRKDSVTRAERLYIEAWENAYHDFLASTGDTESSKPGSPDGEIAKGLEKIALEFPNDVEAKALYVRYTMSDESKRLGNEMIVRDILAKEPDHPGAHHYRIHNWDGKEGKQALESCARYGVIAPNIGHADHMPGHVYSGVGMWHEAAIWMDIATRVEKRSMTQRMIFPFSDWNYRHNRNYLCYIQEQLGIASLSEDGARELLSTPLDPRFNDATKGDEATIYSEGLRALLRNLIKFERFDDVTREGVVPWKDTLECRAWRPYAEALAAFARHDVVTLREREKKLAELKAEQGKKPRGDERDLDIGLLDDEVRGLLAHADGRALEAYEILLPAAKHQADGFEGGNDLPTHPRFLYTVLGELYLSDGCPKLAREAFLRTLDSVKNDGFALSGLARAEHALGNIPAATDAAARLAFVWSAADPKLRWLSTVKALGLNATPKDDSPAPQRPYDTRALESYGPGTWKPNPAPTLAVLDSSGSNVSLDAYRGKNVIVVFYLGDQCPHCIEQLQKFDQRAGDFAKRDATVLAISRDAPEKNKKSEALGALAVRLLSDPDHANARRFHSYDDFEEMEIHSTIFIDRNGDLRWARTGGDPFMDLDFLLNEIDRVDAMRSSAPAPAAPRG